MGNVWRKAHVATEYTEPFRVIFEGVVGKSFEVGNRNEYFAERKFCFFRETSVLTMWHVCQSHVKNRIIAILNKIRFVDGKMSKRRTISIGK